jgi:SAM-dependent methyltransferase
MPREGPQLIPMGMGIDQHAVLYRTADKIIRAIKPRSTEFYREAIQHPVIIQLMNDGVLINTRESNIKIEGHELVLEHPLLPVVSYPFEWTPSMYRDAAINLLRLNLALLDAGFCTHDSHPWNIIFDGTTPKFVDFTSIIKAVPNNRWRAKGQFVNYCLDPLLIMEAGFPTTARNLLREIFKYPETAMVNALLKRSSWTRSLASRLPPDAKKMIRQVMSLTKKVVSAPENEDDRPEIKAMLTKVESLKLSPKIAEWSEYYSGKNELPIYDGSVDVLNQIQKSTPKHQIIGDILKKISPRSVLDMGCNRGLYSQMAALLGSRVVGIDVDERALDDMYLDSKRLKTNAMPLYVNAVAPAQAIGFKEIPFPPVTERLRSELVMCLALVHHLVFKITRMSFSHIAKLFDSYSEKYLLVEFVPKDDSHIEAWYTDEFAWYDLDNFKSALSQYFPEIEVFESFPSPRVILYCEKRQP